MSTYGVGLRVQVESILHDTRQKIFKNIGATGIARLSRNLRRYDTSRTGFLSPFDFETALRDLGLFYSKHQLQCFTNFYGNEHKQIEYDRFLAEYRTPLNQRKLHAIHAIFKILDANGNGVIEPDDLQSKFVVQSVEKFISGQFTRDQALAEFFEIFDTNKDGAISITEFEEYYSYISQLVAVDEQFEQLLINTWGVDFKDNRTDVDAKARRFIQTVFEE